MCRFRFSVAVVTLVAVVWITPSYGQPIHFAQITDAHIFDTENKDDSRVENERVLRWAIDEINRRNALGPAYEFVVFTGDVGLEQVTDDDASMKRAVSDFREFVARSQVRQWLLVPGNNDLPGEDPRRVGRFHAFVAELKESLGTSKCIMDLAPVKDKLSSSTLAVGKCLFVGFDDASFKSNNNVKQQKEEFVDEQLACLDLLRQEIDLKNKKDALYPYVYIFCHIPDIDDPYYARIGAAGRCEIAKKKPEQKEKFTDPKFAASAWTVTSDIRDKWLSILRVPRVQRVFVGHFHTDDSRWYGDPTSASKDYRKPGDDPYPQESFDKLLICPPIAVKNQIRAVRTARGFRDVRINGDSGKLLSEIVWADAARQLLYDNPPATQLSPATQPTDCGKKIEELKVKLAAPKPAEAQCVPPQPPPIPVPPDEEPVHEFIWWVILAGVIGGVIKLLVERIERDKIRPESSAKKPEEPESKQYDCNSRKDATRKRLRQTREILASMALSVAAALMVPALLLFDTAKVLQAADNSYARLSFFSMCLIAATVGTPFIQFVLAKFHSLLNIKQDMGKMDQQASAVEPPAESVSSPDPKQAKTRPRQRPRKQKKDEGPSQTAS